MTIAKVVARAWNDPDYKARLMSDPRAALTESGIDVPAGTGIKVLEDTADIVHIVLPVAPPKADELSIEELENVAAGMAQQYTGLPM